jgi:peroxiredoxin/ribosomal protein S18 acetylase RimI-like enzyme
MTRISTQSRKPDLVQIRRATVSDMAAVAAVLRDAFLEFKSLYTEAAFAETTADLDTLVRRLDEGPIWVARLRDKIVGTISAVEKPNGIYVRSTAVLPSARGNRIAKMLLEHVESFAVSRRAERLFLSTTPFLHAAIHLYEDFGFRRTNEPPHDLFNTPLFTMEKKLQALVTESDLMQLPDDLPIPKDDGGCDHLVGLALPPLPLAAANGSTVDLSTIPGCVVVFAYPRTGRPNESPLVSDWDLIPGARGCTPQTCGFRDLHSEFQALNCRVYGLSTQSSEFQQEMVARLHVPFPVLSDEKLELARALRLPTFTVAGQILVKRLVMVLESGRVKKVFYPVFPPDKSALTVLEWLKAL